MFAGGISCPWIVQIQIPGDREGEDIMTVTMDSTTDSSATVSGLSPVSGSFAGGAKLVITGSGLGGTQNVVFGDILSGGVGAAPSSVTDTQVEVTAPAHAPGLVDVTLNVSGVNVAAPSFTYDGPAITGMSPDTAPNTVATTITITGTLLDSATTVSFGGTQATVASQSATQLTVATPLSLPAGSTPVSVNFPGLPALDAGTLAVIGPAVTAISPTSGPMTGGTVVTIHGTLLTGATAALFGTIGATPTSVSDTEIVVTAPATTTAGPVSLTVNVPTGVTPAVPAATFTYATPTSVNATFVVDNQTGVPDELVFVKFLGAEIVADKGAPTQTYGAGQALQTGTSTASQSYALSDMLAPLPGTSGTPVPSFAINNYAGGRIYFSLGAELASTTIPAAQLPGDPDFATVYGYVEPSVFPTPLTGNTNIDASYVDFVGIPIEISVRDCASDALVQPPANNPLTTTSGSAIFTALTSDKKVPANAVVAASGKTYASASGNHETTIGGTARILSPSLYDPTQFTGGTAYPDWTGSGSLLAALASAGTTLNVASYKTVTDTPTVPSDTLFGFAGSTTASNIGTGWSEAQGYALTAQAVADLNPGGANKRIPHLEGVAGIKMSGNGDVVGAFDIYITSAALAAQTGIYGANPPYVVDWPSNTTATAEAQIENDLAGRIVGDLLAGFNFGWAGCTTTVAAQAASNGLAATLAGTIFDVTDGPQAGTAIGQLTTGQFFYLLSLQPSTADLSQWYGAAIQPTNPSWYNCYSSDFQALTNCYNMAFTDRLQGGSDPDMFFNQTSDIYVRITLLPGAYTVANDARCGGTGGL